MGRIKQRSIKTLAESMLRESEGSFGKDFSRNKEAVNSSMKIKSKKIRNVIAGYITKRMKSAKES